LKKARVYIGELYPEICKAVQTGCGFVLLLRIEVRVEILVSKAHVLNKAVLQVEDSSLTEGFILFGIWVRIFLQIIILSHVCIFLYALNLWKIRICKQNQKRFFKRHSFTLRFVLQVSVGENKDWKLGVVSESAQKKGLFDMSPTNGYYVIWWSGSQLRALTAPPLTKVQL
ncbi:hypothetical protein GOODEAATRI_021540, partial [Goodea atripinnis]